MSMPFINSGDNWHVPLNMVFYNEDDQ